MAASAASTSSTMMTGLRGGFCDAGASRFSAAAAAFSALIRARYFRARSASAAFFAGSLSMVHSGLVA
jgi:hypothetical protein